MSGSTTFSPNPAPPSAKVTATGAGYPSRKGLKLRYGQWTSPTIRCTRKGAYTASLVAGPATAPVEILAYTNRKWAPYGPAAILQVKAPAPEPVPVPAGITKVTIETTPTSATIAWYVDPPATGQVRYGPTSSYGKASAAESTKLARHVQTITGLQPATTYHFAIVSGRQTADATFTTCWAP